MNWAANESYDKWVWRNTTDQNTPFHEWKEKRDAERKSLEAQAQKYRAEAAAKKEQEAWAYMQASFAAAAAKFGTAAKLP